MNDAELETIIKDYSIYKNNHLESRYNNYLTLENTLDICSDFLKTINDNYLNDFNKALFDGTFEIYDIEDCINDNKNKNCFEIIKSESGNYFKSIRIGLNHNLRDVYNILYYFFYFENDKYGHSLSDEIDLFTLFDYLNKNDYYIEDNNTILHKLKIEFL